MLKLNVAEVNYAIEMEYGEIIGSQVSHLFIDQNSLCTIFFSLLVAKNKLSDQKRVTKYLPSE